MSKRNKPVAISEEDSSKLQKRMRISSGKKIRNRRSEYITRADLAMGSLEFHLSKLPKRKVEVP